MKFYVNEIAETIDELTPLPWGEHYVGLFSQCETKGEGSFCGYYSCEKYLNTELLAYCVYKKCRHRYPRNFLRANEGFRGAR